MDEPTVLRTTKIGGGFVKEDVMTYLDELNSKIVSLEDELKKAQETGPADPQELVKYRNQVDSLQEKLNTSNNALRAAKKELDDAKKQHEADQKLIAQLKAGGAGAAAAVNAQANAQSAAALEAAKKEIDNLRNQLRNAAQKPTGDAQSAAALEAAKKEIDNLRNQLKVAEQKAAASANTVPAANSANAEELAKAKQEIAKITGELRSKTDELAAKTKEADELNNKISQLAKDGEAAAAKKDEEISALNKQVAELKDAANNPTLMMGSLFAEAQKTVNQLTQQARNDAEKVTKEATEKAEKILQEANSEAAKTIKDANITAETCIKDANIRAKSTVDDANSHADKINEMSSTVRNMLLNEIESVNTKFADITSVLNRLSGQANDRMSEAQLIIGEARKALGSEEESKVKKAEAPKADFKPTEAPVASLSGNASSASKPASVNQDDPFAKAVSTQYANGNSGYNNGNYNNNTNTYNKPAAPVHQQNQQPKQPVKKSANFNFDMAELLKAAEEEAAKETEA